MKPVLCDGVIMNAAGLSEEEIKIVEGSK